MQSQQKRPNYDRFEAFLPGIGTGIPGIGILGTGIGIPGIGILGIGIGIPGIGLMFFFFTINYPEKGKLVDPTFSSSVNFIVIRPQLNTVEHRYKHFYWMFKWNQLLSTLPL